uniref:Uncharacterized protein n=1 Tax=viral metagenome TaxID=1070528 RepID=A0A6M3IIU4_9ZZZZ
MLKTFVYGNFRGGIQDRNVIRLPSTYLRDLVNFRVERGSLITRKGTARRNADVLESGAAIQGLHEYWDESQDNHLLVAVNGKIYRDDLDGDGPDNDITGSLSLETSQDARWAWVNYDGACYGTDGVTNFYIASSSAAAVAMTTLGRDVPSQSKAMAVLAEQLWLANFTDMDGTVRSYGTIHSDPLVDGTMAFLGSSGARNDFNRRWPVYKLQEHAVGNTDVLMIYKKKAIWWAQFAPSQSAAVTNFAYNRLPGNVGLSGPYGVVSTPEGLMHIDKPGIYWLPANDLTKPRYIGKPVETFWGSVEASRLYYVAAGEVPEQNGVIFCVPYGADQSDNNRAIYINYESWAEEGLEADDLHPAMSIYKGVSDGYYAFNCLCRIQDTDGRERLVGGGYDGYVYTIEEGTQDVDQNYICSATLPFIGDPSMQWAWQDAIIDGDLNSEKVLSITQRNYDVDVPYEQIVTGGAKGFVLDESVLDLDVLGGDALGSMRADLVGESRYMELEIKVLSGVEFAIHSVVVRAEADDTY